jgi:hypothetical protein
MPAWTFPPAIQDVQRWNGFSDADVCSIAHRNAESLYPALAERLLQSKGLVLSGNPEKAQAV